MSRTGKEARVVSEWVGGRGGGRLEKEGGVEEVRGKERIAEGGKEEGEDS